jgi:multicomponent Na+:H+ antiporter subunit E
MKLLHKSIAIVSFMFFYLTQLVKANFIIAWEILTPRLRINPSFVEVDVFLKSDFGLLLFSNLVSMTPGSLVADISQDKKTILVHVLYNKNHDKTVREINDIQNRVQRIVN